MLRAGIEKEKTQLIDVTAKEDKKISVKAGAAKESKKESTTKKAELVKAPITEKHKGGRPTNKEKGLKSRRQYTLTLKENDYSAFLEAARKNDLSFAKFMEKAAFEYIESHKNS